MHAFNCYSAFKKRKKIKIVTDNDLFRSNHLNIKKIGNILLAKPDLKLRQHNTV